MSSKRKQSESDNPDVCPICHETSKVYAVAHCNHPICFRCSTRLRYLHKQFYCPICRADCDKVLFVHKIQPYDKIVSNGFQVNRKAKVWFEDASTSNEFEHLIAHNCSECYKGGNQQSFKTFKDLQMHIQRNHQLFFCNICIDGVKLFSQERKAYNRQDLAKHKRYGDKDDKSFKGHPLCQICDMRFLDTDELWRHLRKDHFFCHFCDADGEHIYFGSYDDVKDHFKSDHYMCEEGACANVQFTNAFRTEMDLKAHKAQYHLKGVKRSQQRQARTIDIDFSYNEYRRNPRENRKKPGNGDNQESSADGGRVKAFGRGNGRFTQEDLDTAKAIAASMGSTQSEPTMQQEVYKESVEDFPSLSGNSVNSNLPKPYGPHQRININSEVDYPSLGKPLGNSVSDATANASKSAKSSTIAAVKAKSNPWSNSDDEFPVLHGSGSRPHPHGWHLKKPEPKSALKFVNNSRPAVDSMKDFPTLGDKPAGSLASLGSWINQTTSSTSSTGSTRATQSASSNSVASNTDKPTPQTAGKAPQTAGKNKKKKTTKNAAAITDNKSDNIQNDPSNGRKANELSSSNNTKTTSSSMSLDVSKQPSTASQSNKSKASKSQVKSKKLASLEDDLNDAPVTNDAQNGKAEESDSKTNMNGTQATDEKNQENNSGRESSLCSRETSLSEIDYPSLSSKRPPPGLDLPNKKTETPPAPGLKKQSIPPGFSTGLPLTKKSQPPGLEKADQALNLSSLANMIDPVATNTSSMAGYVEPPSFSQRSKKLSFKLKELIHNDMTKFHKFKNFSVDFRNGNLSAKQFYEQCDTLLGYGVFSNILPELVALLPDIKKQQQLYSLCKDRLFAHSVSHGEWNVGKSTKLIVCKTCQQVVLEPDMSQHEASHGVGIDDFPTLGMARQVRKAW